MPLRSRLRKDLALILVIAVGLLLRLIVMVAVPQSLTTDRDLYLGIAREIQAGHGYATPGLGSPTAFRPPLYPLLLSALPLSPDGRYHWLPMAGLHLGLSLLMIYAVARSVDHQSLHGATLSRGGLLATGLVAVDPLLVTYTAQPMTETLCAALTAGLLCVLTSAPCAAPLVTSRRRAILIGALWGLCALARPTYLVPLGLWLSGKSIIEGWVAFRGGALPIAIDASGANATPPPVRWRAMAQYFVGVIAGTALVLSPWIIRNTLVFGHPIATTTHGGYTLWLANNPVFYSEVVESGAAAWDGVSLDRWQAETNREMVAANIQGEIAQDDWQSAKAKAFIGDHPGGFARAALYRAGAFWSMTPGPQTDASRHLGWVVGIYYAGVWLLALAAVVRFVRARAWQELWLPVALIAGFFVVHLVYWTDTRMRAPIVPAIAVLIGRSVRCRHRCGCQLI